VLELDIQMRFCVQTSQVNTAEEDSKSESINVQHATSDATVHNLEKIRRNYGEALTIIAYFLESRVIVKHGMKDIQEEVQRILVEEVDLTQ
jgi:hypothetical protein